MTYNSSEQRYYIDQIINKDVLKDKPEKPYKIREMATVSFPGQDDREFEVEWKLIFRTPCADKNFVSIVADNGLTF